MHCKANCRYMWNLHHDCQQHIGCVLKVNSLLNFPVNLRDLVQLKISDVLFLGGKKCLACGERIYHDKWHITPKLAEERWAYKEARARELSDVVDFLE